MIRLNSSLSELDLLLRIHWQSYGSMQRRNTSLESRLDLEKMSAGVEVGPAPNSHGLTALPERATRPPSDAGRVGENLSQLEDEPPCRPLELLVPLGQKRSVSAVRRLVNPRRRPFVLCAIPASCRIRSGGTPGAVLGGEGDSLTWLLQICQKAMGARLCVGSPMAATHPLLGCHVREHHRL